MKIKVAVLYGGRSPEHEVSITSARNVIKALDKEKYDILAVKIPKSGKWDTSILKEIDVVFPLIHGSFGEDGTMQGLLEQHGVPYVGAGVLGSAIGMDKDITKRLLRDAKIPIAKFLVFKTWDKNEIRFSNVKQKLGLPFFVKPADSGSSIGITKVKKQSQFKDAVNLAFSISDKIIIEENIKGREIECSVLGNDFPVASIPGEIVPDDEYYTYESKYSDKSRTKLVIPVELPPKIVKKVQELSIRVYGILEVNGMARVDFFLTPRGKLIVNEINTIPGFTNISMYPKLWEASGLTYPDLMDRLIELAFE